MIWDKSVGEAEKKNKTTKNETCVCFADRKTWCPTRFDYVPPERNSLTHLHTDLDAHKHTIIHTV